MNTDVDTSRRTSELVGLQKYGMLLMGIFLVILAGGRFVTPSAAFLAPVFLLRYTRNTSVKTGMVVLYVLLFLSLLVRLHDYLAVARPINLFLIAGIAIIELLPFIADRTLREYLPTFLRPLVLPTVFVVLGFTFSQLMPFGTMGEKAYTQVGNNELMQLLSVTGTHGITFVIFWFAATMASFWDSGFVWQRNRSQLMPLALCLMIVFVAGGFRIIFDENEAPTVRIAGVIADQTPLWQSLEGAGVVRETPALSGSFFAAGFDREIVDAAFAEQLRVLATHTTQLAKAGASIVSWAEASAVAFKSGEMQFNATASELARQNNIYLIATIALIEDPPNKILEPIENKLVVFAPTGDKLGQYVKAKPLWNENIIKGDGLPLVIDTPHGKLAFTIGFDMDFPALLRQAGNADIVIAPAADWRTLAPHHSLMATYRGVENGLSVFRPTYKGVSLASDSHGRVLARTDHFRSSAQNFIADVPTAGVNTFYTRAGDWFAWLVMLILFVLLLTAYLAARKRKKRELQGGGGPSSPDDVRDRSRITAIQWREAERDNNLHRNN